MLSFSLGQRYKKFRLYSCSNYFFDSLSSVCHCVRVYFHPRARASPFACVTVHACHCEWHSLCVCHCVRMSLCPHVRVTACNIPCVCHCMRVSFRPRARVCPRPRVTLRVRVSPCAPSLCAHVTTRGIPCVCHCVRVSFRPRALVSPFACVTVYSHQS